MSIIVIVGGVATGMSCTTRLRRLDEQIHVIVLEKGMDISIASCGLSYFVGGEIVEEAAFRVQTPKPIYDFLNLDIRVNTEVLAVDSVNRSFRIRSSQGEEGLAYDAPVLAFGARSVDPSIPGIDLPFVKTLCTIPDAVGVKEMAEPGGRAVVTGAGFIGLEATESLCLAGMEVVLVEGSDYVLPPVEEELPSFVPDELERTGITVTEPARVSGIEDEGGRGWAIVEGIDALEVDLVPVAVGACARIKLALSAGIRVENGAIDADNHGRTFDEYIWAAGDVVLSTIAATGARRPAALVGSASRAGCRIADDIISVLNGQASAARETVKSLGTVTAWVGDLQVAITGFNSRKLT